MSAGSSSAAAAAAASGSAEPCSHPVQVSGLCAICGVELGTLSPDARDASTADEPVSILHSVASLKVTRSEAARLHAQTTSDLLNTRRLALIIDLDQTVIHATVDPTVGEWMKDRSNPNHGALRDVKRFRLGMDGKPVPKVTKATRRARSDAKAGNGVAIGSAATANGKAKKPSPAAADAEDGKSDSGDSSKEDDEGSENGKKEDDGDDEEEEDDDDDPSLGCWYYIKPRPGLPAFLRHLSTLYELHVYTMGTRSYAASVCAIIDPEGTLFGDRILSRDENDDGASAALAATNSAAAAAFRKSLARLFPVDTSMVVIIDDRADVWKWSPNLVKVVPFDFFVGIGDINASFLPATPAAQSPTSRTTPETESSSPVAESTSSPTSSPATPSSSATAVSPSPSSAASSSETLTEGADEAQRVALEAQAAERPLAKMQEALEVEEAGSASTTDESVQKEDSGAAVAPAAQQAQDETSASASAVQPARAAVLKEDDRELDRLRGILEEIHSRWYNIWGKAEQDMMAQGRPSTDALSQMPDVAAVIVEMKARVLRGCHIVFSGVVPLGQQLETSEPWRMATEFGARCHRDLTSSVTHLVAARGGTAKVYQAQRQKHPRIWIVRPKWLSVCCERWSRAAEEEWGLEDGVVESGGKSRLVGRGAVAPLPSATAASSADANEGDVTRIGGDNVDMVLAEDNDNNANVDDEEDDDDNHGPAFMGSSSSFSGFDAVDWGEAADEVDAFLDGLDDEGDTTDGGYGSDQSLGRAKPNDRPPASTKRTRTDTEDSDVGDGENEGDPPSSSPLVPDENTRSPLSKRRKVTIARSGHSKLKHSFDPSGANSDEGDDDDVQEVKEAGSHRRSWDGLGLGGRRRGSSEDGDADGDGDDEGESGASKRSGKRKRAEDDDDDEDDEDDSGLKRHSLFRNRAAGRSASGQYTADQGGDGGTDPSAGAGASRDNDDGDDDGASMGSQIDESFLDGLADEIALDLEQGE
ncbi:hypothetical protein V8E36_007088 [Tilletia maclaganii]